MFYWCFIDVLWCFMMFVDILWCLMMCFDVQNTLNLEMQLTFSRPVADHFACPFGHRSVGLWESSWFPVAIPCGFGIVIPRASRQWKRPSKCSLLCPAVLAKQDGKIHFGANGKRSHLTQHTPMIPPRNKNPLTPHLPTYMGLSENSVSLNSLVHHHFRDTHFSNPHLDAIILRGPDSCARRHRFERQPDISGMICSSDNRACLDSRWLHNCQVRLTPISTCVWLETLLFAAKELASGCLYLHSDGTMVSHGYWIYWSISLPPDQIVHLQLRAINEAHTIAGVHL